MRRPRGGGGARSARFVVLAISIVAGGGAAYLASGSDEPAAVREVVVQQPSVEVLVAKVDIGLGQSVTEPRLQWQAWPQSTAGASLIRRADRPDAMTRLAGSIARAPFIAGEPIREAKLVSVNGTGFMAAILPTGMRAISTPISPETGAGGFILPNDRVDVILSKREQKEKGATETIKSEVVMTNIRVLAIDQAPKEKDGQNALIGRTATLEVSLTQAEVLARSHMSGTLSLALRSLVDGDGGGGEGNGKNKMIAVYRGVGNQSLYSCKPTCELR